MSSEPIATPILSPDEGTLPLVINKQRHGFFRYVSSARPRRVIGLVIFLWILNGFDLIFTVTAARQHLLYELNPLAQYLLSNGEIYLVLYKFGLLATASYALLKFRTERIVEMGVIFTLVVYSMVAVHWRDCYDVYVNTDAPLQQKVLLDPITSLSGD